MLTGTKPLNSTSTKLSRNELGGCILASGCAIKQMVMAKKHVDELCKQIYNAKNTLVKNT